MKTLPTLILAGLTTIAMVGPAEAEDSVREAVATPIDLEKAIACTNRETPEEILSCITEVAKAACLGPGVCANTWCYEFHGQLEGTPETYLSERQKWFGIAGTGTDYTPGYNLWPDDPGQEALSRSAFPDESGTHVLIIDGSGTTDC